LAKDLIPRRDPLVRKAATAVIQKLYERHREFQQRREEGEFGFTLIELLIVIVVLAILAATVIFALGGITGSSAQAACDSDAKSVEVAVEAYKNFPGNGDNWPGASSIAEGTATPAGTQTNTALTASAKGGPYLRTYPSGNSTHYYIANDATGGVWVYNVSTTTWTNYDSTTDPCSTVQ
jgi:prepilin-type N-terminal cleavage/methylation domain-containing protein